MKLKRVCVMLLAAIMMGAGTGATVFADEEKTELYHKVFDFGYDNAEDDFAAVTSTTEYTEKLGYGLESLSDIKEGGEKLPEHLEIFRPYDPANMYYAERDYLTTEAEEGITFTADVPDGDYWINVISGGETETGVNIYINGGERVRMYTVEAGAVSGHQQSVVPKNGKITVQIKGKNTKVNVIEVTQIASRTEGEKPIIYIAGDSTAQTYDWSKYYPQTGWGQVIGDYLSDSAIIENRAIGGRSLKSYNNDGRLDSILTEMHPGDYVIIQFGHNDGSSKPERFISVDDFKILLEKKYITEIKKRGGTPIIFTPTPHFSPNDKGEFAPTILDYSAAAVEIGEKCGAVVIDIQKAIADYWNVCGQNKVKTFYFINEPLESAQYPDGTDDHTHFKEIGAREVAQVIAKELMKNIPELKDAFVLERKSSFTDTKGHWAENIINNLYESRYVEGVSDAEFSPDAHVTRAEFLAMSMRACGIAGHGYREGECLDAPSDAWYRFYVQSAIDKGLIPKNMINGYEEIKVEIPAADDKLASEKMVIEGEFNAEQTITREEMAAVVVNCYEYAWTQAGNEAKYYIINGCTRISNAFNVRPIYIINSKTKYLEAENNKFCPVEEDVFSWDRLFDIPNNGETVDYGLITVDYASGISPTGPVHLESDVLSGDNISEWAKDYVIKAMALDIMNGYYTDLQNYRVQNANGAATYQMSTTEFAPRDFTTRAQAAKVISEIIKKV